MQIFGDEVQKISLELLQAYALTRKLSLKLSDRVIIASIFLPFALGLQLLGWAHFGKRAT